MASEKDIVSKPVKRNSPDLLFHEETKRIKFEIGEPSCTNNILSGQEETELLEKYKNITTSELENLCERLKYYDSTGIYMPPKQSKSCVCPKKKTSNKNSEFTAGTVSENIDTKFGQGSVGVASDYLEHKNNCSCCDDSFVNTDVRYMPQIDIPGPSFSGLFSGYKMADNIPTTSGLHNGTYPNNTPYLNEDRKIYQSTYYLNNSIALDLSIANENLVSDLNSASYTSDSSNTIFYSDDSLSPLLNGRYPPHDRTDEEPQNLEPNVSLESQESQGDDSVISIPDVTLPSLTSETNDEVVDLTNLTLQHVQHPINSSEVIEVLDDTFRTNLTPGVIETIDLIDSSDDEDIPYISTTSSSAENSQAVINKSNSFECPICFESLKNRKVMSTICGHIFCSVCIQTAIKLKRCCPSCKKKLRRTDFHRIYLNL